MNKNNIDNKNNTLKETKKTKKEKSKKKGKIVSIKKIPKFFTKKTNIIQIEKKIFKYLLLAQDKTFVQSLYIEKEGVYVLNKKLELTKKDIAGLKKITKDIKSQKAFRINLLPLGISIGFIFALFFTIILAKDFVLKLIVQKMGESIFQAKCDIDFAHIEFLNAHIRLEGLQQANKDSVMTNLFEIDLIDLDFDLVQLLKRKFVSENIQVSGLEFGTERKTSGFLPKKEKKVKEQKEKDESAGFNFNAILDLPIIKDEKNDIIDSLSNYNPETILANLQDSLKSPDLAQNILETVETTYKKYETLTSEFEKDYKEVEVLYKDIQSIDINELKNNPTKIPQAVSLGQSALDKTKEVKNNIEKTTKTLNEDRKKVSSYSKEINTAFNADLAFIRSEIKDISSFSFGDAKNLITNEIEKIAIRSLGKYYYYAAFAIDKYKDFSSKPKKEKPKKEKNTRVRSGRLIFYKEDKIPSLLFKNVFVSSHIESLNIEAKIQNISNDMDLWEKPTQAECIIDSYQVKNYLHFVFDTRENRENLISLGYDGSGYELNFEKIKDSLLTENNEKDKAIAGIPNISGTSIIHAKVSADDIDVFNVNGNLILDPCSVESKVFEPAFAFSLYKRALAKLNKMDTEFQIMNTKEDGFKIYFSSEIDSQFMQIFSELMNEEIASIKDSAMKEAESYLKESLSPVYDAIGDFDSIDGLISNQKKKIEEYQTLIDNKLGEIKNAGTAKLEAEKEKALEKSEEAAKNVFKGLF